MGGLRILASSLCLLLAQAAFGAEPFPYDFRISDLGNPLLGGFNHKPQADANFRSFARQLGAALTSVNLAPPETLGHSGFAFTAELSIVDFGNQTVKLPTRDRDFRGPLLIPSVHVRKGLPFSFELGARGAWIEKSRMGAGTLELKWAVNEGFTYLPDIAVRGNLTKLLNSRDFDVTAGGVDLGIGKQFAIGGMVTLTPYVGWNLVFVGASTGNVDFHPERTLAESDRPSSNPQEQFRDIYVFDNLQAIDNTHHRFYGGVRFIGGVVIIGLEISYSVIGKFRDKTVARGGTGLEIDVPSVLAGNFTLGLDF
jgi:hypothetical protein